MMEGTNLGWWDLAVIILYFVIVISFGIWSSRKSRGSVSGFFLASRNMHWVPVGASLFSSCIGAGHFVGLAGSAAASGIAVAGFELGAIFIIIMLGWWFAPVYISSGVYTMPEYLRERFGGQRIRVYLALLSLILYIFTKISAELYAGALFIQLALNKPSPEWLYVSILIILGVAALFTIAGGLTAVIWTDFIQTILMISGALILMGKAFYEVGGFNSLVEKYPYAIALDTPYNDSCGKPPSNYMSLLRTIEPGKSDYPWTGIVFGLTISAIWYWCTDQVIVQRTLASKNLSHAKAGCILASYIKIFPLFVLILPGMAARVLYPDRIGCSDPEKCMSICGSPGGCTNIAYIELVVKLMPTGLAGLMLSVMMAAVMSSLTSIFNSSSTIFTIDIWTRFRKHASDTELIIVGRITVVALVVISTIWIPVLQNSNNAKLFDYIQSITAFLAPSICVVFILAIFWPRTNEPGAFWGLIIGLGIGIIRFIMEFSYPPPPCGSKIPDSRPYLIIALIDKIHYLHFGCILFLITGIIVISISLLTKPIPQECLYRLTYWSRHSTIPRKKIDSYEEQPIKIVEEADTRVTKEKEVLEVQDVLKEDPKWKRIVDYNAVFCICIAVFLWGFFA